MSSEIRAVEVDGKLLIDSPTAWNTSQVWSETVPFITQPGGDIRNKSNAFDGSTTTTAFVQGPDLASKAYTIDLTGKGLSGDVRVSYTGRADGTGVTIRLNDGPEVDASDYNDGVGVTADSSR